MSSDHKEAWTPLLVTLNTAFTMLGGVAGLAALVISLIALLKVI